MSVEQSNVIDFVGIDKKSGVVSLTIADALDWTDPAAHRELLRQKIGNYLAFIESQELHQIYPNAVGRKVVINVVLRHRPNEDAVDFMRQTAEILMEYDVGFAFRNLDDDVDEGCG